MKFKKYIVIVTLLLHKIIVAQNPQCFNYTDEGGMPSNEIYSVVQDYKGFVWFGCDAGLYKYDGIRCRLYKGPKQKAKSVTGLTISSSGKLYCFNFQSQVFMLQGDTLIEISNLFPSKITSITSNENGEVFISHSGGIHIYNEQKNNWTKFGTNNYELAMTTNSYVTKNSKHHPNDTVFFLETNGISQYIRGKKELFKTDIFKKLSPGSFFTEYYKQKLWLFATENNTIYRYSKNNIEPFNNSNLLNLLAHRKITNVTTLPDENLWICTYKGIIKYNADSEVAELFYPEISFSDCTMDREGNYWFSTLQTGLLRIPNIHLLVWNTDNKLLDNDKAVKITYGDDHIYFATIDGTIGKLNHNTHQLTTFHTGNHGDIQSFDYDINTKTLRFYTNNNLFSLKENAITHQDIGVKAIKTIKQIGNDCFIGSSHGLYINNKIIKSRWIREIEYDESNHTVWVASSDGLMKVVYQNNEWSAQTTLFKGEQILSINFDKELKLIYALTFNGKIYSVNQDGESKFVSGIIDKTLALKIKKHKEIIYVATNKGLWKYSIKKNTWETITKLSGLASDNIQSLVITNENVWLATGKGVQKIPLTETYNKSTSIVYLKKIIAGKTLTHNPTNLTLNYGESLVLFPEASTYNSNGNFQYLYRINSTDTSWVKLPSSIEQIDIQNIPPGYFEIQLKVINHLGLDSENTIVLSGTIKPPFWKSLWFNVLIAILILVLSYIIYTIRIRKMQQLQRKEIERINLENELRLSRETALKSQMNPHFVFNVLNSIKAYIYKNDKQKATSYLNEFSDLIRVFLQMSNKPLISLSEEIRMLKLYIDMEAMLLGDDFSFQINIDDNLDIEQTYMPSLILQPFIENAFKHGLHNKQGNKQLIISFSPSTSDSIEIEITDNGIGRIAAQQTKETEKLKHESFATSAIQKRIELLNKHHQTVSFMIHDLYDENKQALGTTVKLKVRTEA